MSVAGEGSREGIIPEHYRLHEGSCLFNGLQGREHPKGWVTLGKSFLLTLVSYLFNKQFHLLQG